MSRSEGSAATPYDLDFYKSQSGGSYASARCVVPLVMQCIGPKSVLDVGCGVGTWLRVFHELGVETITGMDGDYVDRSALQIDPANFVPTDISAPFTAGRSYDLAVCLEVAEHLKPESGVALVKHLVASAPFVLFSAAIPGQLGTDHINEQWQDHWRRLFANEGYVAVDLVRPQVWGLPDVEPWYQQNIILYAGPVGLAAKPELRPVAAELSLDLVHPTFFNRAIDDGAMFLRKSLVELPNMVAAAIANRLPGAVPRTSAARRYAAERR